MSPRKREDDHDVWPLGSGSVDEEPWKGGVLDVPAASGTVTLSQGNTTTARPPQASGVLAWRSTKGPMNVVLIVDVAAMLGSSAANPYAQEQLLFTQLSGLNMGTVQQPAGVLRIAYGYGTTLRTIEADMRSGSFQLPPCDVVTVDAYIFGLGPITAKVSAAVVPGRIPNGARFTSTWKPTLNAAASASEPVPFGARWVALAGGAASGIGANQPIFSLSQAGGGVYLLHDFVNGVFVSQPGQPVELVSRGAVTILNGGNAAAAGHVKFFLET